MKTNTFLIIFLYSLISTAQINLKKVEFIGDTIVPKPKMYDGKSDFEYQNNPKDYQQYIGYNIYLNDSKVEYNNNLYDRNIKDFKTNDGSILKTYLINPKEDIKDGAFHYYNSDNINYVNKKYKILDVIYDKDYDENARELKYFNPKLIKLFGNIKDYKGPDMISSILLELKDELTQDTIYLRQKESNYSITNIKDFIFEPNYNYIVKKFNSKKFILTSDPYSNLKDLYTNNLVKFVRNSIWTNEVAVLNMNRVENNHSSFQSPYLTYFLLKNDAGETIALNYYFIKNCLDNECSKFEFYDSYLEELRIEKLNKQQREYEKALLMKKEKEVINKRKMQIINKYGTEIGNLILKGNVYIKMSKEMCRDSWGEPYEISKSITEDVSYETWHYGGNYLLFKNNVLFRISIN